MRAARLNSISQLIVQQHQIINDLIIPNFLHFVLENQ